MSLVPADEIRDEIHGFIVENAVFFARWYNGIEHEHAISWLENRLADEWILVNARIPGMYATSRDFLSVFPTLHGQSAGDPVTSRVEFKVTWELATGVYLTSYIQHFESHESVRSHPETSVLHRQPDGGLKVLFVQE